MENLMKKLLVTDTLEIITSEKGFMEKHIRRPLCQQDEIWNNVQARRKALPNGGYYSID